MAVLKPVRLAGDRKRKLGEDRGDGDSKNLAGDWKKSKINDAKRGPPSTLIKNKVVTKHDTGRNAPHSKLPKRYGDTKARGNTQSPKLMKSQGNTKVEKPMDRKARKELAETRKKKRKPNYDLEKEVKILWEKMRQRNLEKEERSKLAAETLKKMKGKLAEMCVSHIASRVLQACAKYCKQPERDSVFEELRPHALTLSRNTYAYHLVIKMLDHANKSQLQQLLSILHGHVVALLRHPVGSAVVEHAYQLANGVQKQELLCEFYSPEYRLFKGVTGGKGKLSHLMASQPVLKQNAMLEHMMLSLQPILEKGIVDHSITHRALVEYLSVCKKAMVEDVVKSLAGALLVRMIHTKDGAKVGVICVKLSTVKERKNIIKSMKGHVSKIAQDEHSSVVLLAILDVVDDTKLISKIIIPELMKDLKDLACHKYGRRWLLHLLAPGVPRYFPSEVLAVLQHPRTANWQDAAEPSAGLDTSVLSAGTVAPEKPEETSRLEGDEEGANAAKNDSEADVDTGKELRGISKKDSALRRFELLSSHDLGKKLADVCTDHADELLKSPLGTDVIYEVSMGGVDGVMWRIAAAGILSLHKAIADAAAKPPVTGETNKAEKEHVFQQYHASRTIRRLILNSESSPAGASSFSLTLWDNALRGKCEIWAKGHSAKVVSAYKLCRDGSARDAADKEVQELMGAGLLKQN